MLGGHIQKLFRLGPDEIRQTSRHLRAWQSALLVRLLPGETAFSYTRKSYPQLNGSSQATAFLLKNRIG